MSSNPRPDRGRSPFARWLGAADEGFFKFESTLNLIAALVILAVMFIGVFQVFGRKLLNFPVPGYVDVIEFVMTVFAFISIAYTQRLGGHVRMEIILKRIRGRGLWIVEFLGTLTALGIVAILTWFAYGHFLRAWTIGDSTIDIEIPLWPSKLLVPDCVRVPPGKALHSAPRLPAALGGTECRTDRDPPDRDGGRAGPARDRHRPRR